MSFDNTHHVREKDNKDPTTTILTCENEQGNTVTVEVDPTELFINMIENLGDDMSVAQAAVDWLNEQI